MAPVQSKTWAALNDVLTLVCPAGPVDVIISDVGGGVATIQLQDSLDGGTTFQPVRVNDEDAGTQSTDMTAAGMFSLRNVVLRQPQLKCTAFTGARTSFVLMAPKTTV